MLSLHPVNSMKLVDVQAIKALKSFVKYSSLSSLLVIAAKQPQTQFEALIRSRIYMLEGESRQ